MTGMNLIIVAWLGLLLLSVLGWGCAVGLVSLRRRARYRAVRRLRDVHTAAYREWRAR
jgi:hypothetical protein